VSVGVGGTFVDETTVGRCSRGWVPDRGGATNLLDLTRRRISQEVAESDARSRAAFQGLPRQPSDSEAMFLKLVPQVGS